MSKEPGREQNWYPVSKLGWFTGHIREGVETTCRQLGLLQPARARPNVLDDATVARIIRVHRDQAGDLTLFQNQAGRRKTDRGLTGAQRAGIAAYETLIAQLRQVNSDVLAVAAGLSHGTIETVLAKSDLQLGVEALRGGAARIAVRSGLTRSRVCDVSLPPTANERSVVPVSNPALAPGRLRQPSRRCSTS